MKTYATVIALSIALLGMTGCANQPYSPNQNGGAVIGAVLGGALGNQVGKGRGRTAATILGALGGAALGSNVGQSMDDVNRIKAQQYQQSYQQPSYRSRTRVHHHHHHYNTSNRYNDYYY